MVLADAGAREATVRGLAGTLEYEIDKDQAVELRDIARHLLTSTDFGLNAQLLEQTAARADAATGLLHSIAQLAAPTTPSEIIEDAVGPYGVPRNEADWHNENVRRLGRPYQSSTLVIQHRIENLDVAQAKEILEQTYVASHYADHGTSYARVRFAGNGRAVAYWDNDAQAGVTFIGDDVTDLDSLEPPWPAWSMRVDDLLTEMEQRVTAPRSA